MDHDVTTRDHALGISGSFNISLGFSKQSQRSVWEKGEGEGEKEEEGEERTRKEKTHAS